MLSLTSVLESVSCKKDGNDAVHCSMCPIITFKKASDISSLYSSTRFFCNRLGWARLEQGALNGRPSLNSAALVVLKNAYALAFTVCRIKEKSVWST